MNSFSIFCQIIFSIGKVLTLKILFRRSAKYVMDSENTSFLQDMKPETYFVDGNFNYAKFAGDQMHWSGVLTSNNSLLWR